MNQNCTEMLNKHGQVLEKVAAFLNLKLTRNVCNLLAKTTKKCGCGKVNRDERFHHYMLEQVTIFLRLHPTLPHRCTTLLRGR